MRIYWVLISLITLHGLYIPTQSFAEDNCEKILHMPDNHERWEHWEKCLDGMVGRILKEKTNEARQTARQLFELRYATDAGTSTELKITFATLLPQRPEIIIQGLVDSAVIASHYKISGIEYSNIDSNSYKYLDEICSLPFIEPEDDFIYTYYRQTAPP